MSPALNPLKTSPHLLLPSVVDNEGTAFIFIVIPL